jgi:hypothetical protein
LTALRGVGLTVYESVCYNLIRGAWTDALGGRASRTGLDLGCLLFISCPLTPGIRLYGVEVDETGDTMDSKERPEIKGSHKPMKISWGRSSVG